MVVIEMNKDKIKRIALTIGIVIIIGFTFVAMVRKSDAPINTNSTTLPSQKYSCEWLGLDSIKKPNCVLIYVHEYGKYCFNCSEEVV
jgi:hypothetical protein